jgi:hypothetical protein
MMKAIALKVAVYLKIILYFFKASLQYFAEPVSRIFGPDDDAYPAIGLQPYEGDYSSKGE